MHVHINQTGDCKQSCSLNNTIRKNPAMSVSMPSCPVLILVGKYFGDSVIPDQDIHGFTVKG
jgi:hypothetical protein